MRPWSDDRPTIAGVARERETLEIFEGEWKSATPITFEYQWLRCSTPHPISCRDITGAKEKTYVARAEDVGSNLRVLVVAGNDAGNDAPRTDLEVASGCFMFLRRALAQQVGGFDRRFFLYFEDFDLAWRIRARAKVARVPDVRIVHFGGGAARKGFDHVAMFARSAWIFYRKHGWRLL